MDLARTSTVSTTHGNANAARLAGLCGLASVALTFFSHFALPQDLLSAPVAATELGSWASLHHATIMLGSYVDQLSQLLALAFVVMVARRAHPGGGLLSILAIAGAILLVGVSLAATATSFAAVALATTTADASGLAALLSLQSGLRIIDQLPAALGYGMLGVLIVRTGVLPTLLGWWIAVTAIVTLIVMPVSFFAPTLGVVGFVIFLVFLLWLLVSAGTLVVWPSARMPGVRTDLAHVVS